VGGVRQQPRWRASGADGFQRVGEVVSDVTDMIAAYGRGELTLDELAQRFRDRTWPPRRLSSSGLQEAYNREAEDPEPIAEGSFDEVASAYLQGEITLGEYDVLARAAGDAGPSQK
jgi:hypothetical protein